MKIVSFSINLSAILPASGISTGATAQSAPNEPNVRSDNDIDTTRENNLSGWRVMLANTYPDKTLETGH
jgi:hypothetical protein